MSFVISTDTSANLPTAELQWHQLHLLPFSYIVVFGKVQGRKRAIRSLAENFVTNAELLGHWPIGIAHAGCRKEAMELAELLRAADPKARIIVVDYEPVTGSHVGPGALALFFVAREDA